MKTSENITPPPPVVSQCCIAFGISIEKRTEKSLSCVLMLSNQALSREEVLRGIVTFTSLPLVPRALYNQSNIYVSLRENIQNKIGSQPLSHDATLNPNNLLVVKTIRFDDLLWIVHQRRITEAVVKMISKLRNISCVKQAG